MTKLLKRVAPFLVILAAALVLLYAPDIGPETNADLASFFAAERSRQGYPGLVVAAVRDGSPVYIEAFGRDGRDANLKTRTLFPLGPLSRPLAGLLAAQAEAEGGFSPAASAGVPASARPVDGPDAVALVAELEGAVGRSYAELVAQRLARPLDLAQTRVPVEGDEGRLPTGSGNLFGAPVPRRRELDPALAPSRDLLATAEDLAKLLAWYARPQEGKPLFKNAGAKSRLYEPGEGASGSARGWEVRGEGEALELRLVGGEKGFSLAAAVWPRRGTAILVLIPEHSLIRSEFALPLLLEGGGRILNEGSTPKSLPLGRFYVLLAVLASVHLIVLAWQSADALRWARDVRNRADALGERRPLAFALARMIAGVAGRVALIFAAPALAGAAWGRPLDWGLAFELEPGLAGWFVAALVFGVMRNLARLAWLGGPGRPRLGLRRR